MEIVIVIHIGIAIWLYKYFASNDRGSKEPAGALRAAIYFGIIAVVLAGFINNWVLPANFQKIVSSIDNELTYAQLAQGALLVAIVEESLKFIPLAIFIRKKGYFNEMTDGITYFALAGIWFGALESISYGLLLGAGTGITRAITIPFLHAGLTSIAGLGLARWKFNGKKFSSILWGYLIAIALHFAYDFLLFTSNPPFLLLGFCLAIGINLALFKVYKIAKASDEKRGMSSVGENKFCRNCGVPNPEYNLFCVKCGKKT